MLLRSFQIQLYACVKTEVGRRLVNSACFKISCASLQYDIVELHCRQDVGEHSRS